MKSKSVEGSAFALVNRALSSGVCDAWVDVNGNVHPDVGEDDWSTVGAGRSSLARAHARHNHGHGAPGHPGQRLSWQHSKHGNHVPDEHLHPLPLNPDVNNGVFAAAFPNINYISRPQKPFRGERLLALVVRSGASAAGIFPQSEGIFVGVDLQQAQAGNIPIEFWVANAFGVRLYMIDANPGIEIRMPVTLTGTLLTTDTITCAIMVLGRVLA